ncbi:MAG: HlyD family secretion protein [Sphingomonas sp.]
MADSENPQSDEQVPRDGAEASAEQENGREAPLRRPGVRRGLLIAAIVAVAALVWWFIHYESVGKYMQATDDAYVQADAVAVSPKVVGYVEKVFVTDNQMVKPGDPLAQIDPRDYRAQTAQIEAQIDVAQANAQGVEAQIREQQAAVAQARSDLAQAQSAAAFAVGEVARYRPLAASGAESHEKFAQLQDQAHQAQAKVAAARAALVSAQRRIGTLQAQVKQAKAQGESSQAQLAAAQHDLNSTLIRAAIAGQIGDKTAQVGQYVQPATRLMSIVPISKLYITANFKETQLGLMRPGQPATLEVDALSGVDLHGQVESISPGTGAQFSILPPQNATGNFTKIVQRVPVRIAIFAGPATRKLLVPGMSVNVTVDTRSAKGMRDRIQDEQKQFNRQHGLKQ